MPNRAGGWFFLREDRCCEYRPRPQHIGGLCGFCFAGAEPGIRAVALLVHNTGGSR